VLKHLAASFRHARDALSHRGRLARAYLCGEGIEIGALHRRLPVPRAASVLYVDRHTVEGLREQYPELRGVPLARVGRVDDGERLATFAPGSLDFVVANHFLEHAQDPLGTMLRHWEVLRPGGVLYYIVPDKRHTFDRLRPLTAVEHLRRDQAEGPAWSYEGHVREYVRLVEEAGQVAPESCRGYGRIVETQFSIHYHVWTPTSFLSLVMNLQGTGELPAEVLAFEAFPGSGEFACLLRKPAETSSGA
jgi:SAM-dependent methyltransferase